jgi:hypothetical protein
LLEAHFSKEGGQEVKRRRRVNLINPAVGMLIFASCPVLARPDLFAFF